MTAPTVPDRPLPTAVCAGCSNVGTKWHCPRSNHQCDWVICEPCGRVFQRSKPTRWREWKAPAK